MRERVKYDFSGQVAVVTGAARGVGLETALRLHDAGALVAILDRETERLRQARTMFRDPGRVRAFTVDVSDQSQVAATFDQAAAAFGGLDILVNNAGVSGPSKPAVEYSPDEWRRVMSVNLDGAFWCCQSAIRTMRCKGWGRIVNVASVAGKEGNPNGGAYSASKAGLIGLTKSLAKETALQGILVNCIAPTGVNTEILEELGEEKLEYMMGRIPMARFAQPGEVADMILWMVSEACSFTTGAVFDLSGGRLTY